MVQGSSSVQGAHWRPLGKCLVYFVLPLALVMGVALGVAQSQIFDTVGPYVVVSTLPVAGDWVIPGSTIVLGIRAP